MAPGENYIPLAGVAEKWNYPIDDLLEWAVQEEFQLFSFEGGWCAVPCDRIYSTIVYDGYHLRRDQISEMEKKYPELAGNQNDTLRPSERKSLIKMVYAMAIDCYGYDPADKRSDTASMIVAAVARADMQINADTVRKWLKEGARLKSEEP